MTSSEQAAAADIILARIKSSESPAAIVAGGEVKASKNSVLIVLTSLANLWNDLGNSKSEQVRKKPSSFSDSISPSTELTQVKSAGTLVSCNEGFRA